MLALHCFSMARETREHIEAAGELLRQSQHPCREEVPAGQSAAITKLVDSVRLQVGDVAPLAKAVNEANVVHAGKEAYSIVGGAYVWGMPRLASLRPSTNHPRRPSHDRTESPGDVGSDPYGSVRPVRNWLFAKALAGFL